MAKRSCRFRSSILPWNPRCRPIPIGHAHAINDPLSLRWTFGRNLTSVTELLGYTTGCYTATVTDPVALAAICTVDGDKLSLRPAAGDTTQAMVLTVNKDSSIDGPPGTEIKNFRKAN